MKQLMALASMVAMGLGMFAAQAAENTIAYKMMVINETPRGDWETVERRFAWLLPRIAAMCDDQETVERAADMIVAARNVFHDAGIPDSLLETTETLYQMTSAIAPSAKRLAVPLRCAETFASYVVVRSGGVSPEQSKRAVIALVKDLYGFASNE